MIDDENSEARVRFDWIERAGTDFPYYNGSPVGISGRQWWLVMVGVLAGFAILILPPPFLRSSYGALVPAVLYSVIPLATLALVAGRHWTALFRRLRGMDFVWMLLFCILNLVVTLGMGGLITQLFESTANPAVETVAAATTTGRVIFFAKATIQLLGEEIFTILPFLALLYWLTAKRGTSRKAAILIAWLATAVWFALAHLPTYDWHLPQALLGVGVARLVLTLPYIMTKNLWVSTGAHVLNDWAIFGLPLLIGATRA